MPLIKSILAACVACLSAFVCHSETFVWTNNSGDGDWTNKENFLLGSSVPENPPGASDTVQVPDGTTVMLDYDENDEAKRGSCNAFSSIGIVEPMGKNSVFEISVPEGQSFTLNCAVASSNRTKYGKLRKTGLGTLVLASTGKYVGNNNKDSYDYETPLDIQGGTVRFPDLGSFSYGYYRTVSLAAGTTLFTAKNGTTVISGGFTSEAGSVVTNDSTASHTLQIRTKSVLKGSVGSKINLSAYQDAVVELLCTENSYLGETTAFYNKSQYQGGNGGILGVLKFGNKEDSFSSIGKSDSIEVRDLGGGVRYLGTGEVTDKDLNVRAGGSGGHYAFIDGGAVGGLVWTGKWNISKSSSDPFHFMKRLVLAGSNTVPCVMKGEIVSPNVGVTNYTFRITKKGSGKWTMLHNDASDMRGVFAVEEGVLGFDTLAETNVNSALGKSTILQQDIGNVQVDPTLYSVDYAFLLGGGATGTAGAMEYLGSTNSVSSTRPVAVSGRGSILNNAAGTLKISPVSVLKEEGDSTLVLGGANNGNNAVETISDGDSGTLNVVKEGAGMWRIGTNCTFTGSLDVKAGTLVVGNPLFEYYRWVIRSTYSRTTASAKEYMVGLKSFGLFDAEGKDRIYALSHNGDWLRKNIKPAEDNKPALDAYRGMSYSYGSDVFGSASSQRLQINQGHFRFTKYDGDNRKAYQIGNGYDEFDLMTNLFTHSETVVPNFFSRYDIKELLPLPEVTNTWVVFTMRPQPGRPIVGWDYVNTKISEDYQMISNCWLEASVTGLPDTWVRVGDVSNPDIPELDTWQSDGSAYEPGYETHATFMPIPVGETNDVAFSASSVSVAPGAELYGSGKNSIPVPKIVVDSDGMGRLCGFALSEGGTIEISNPKNERTYSIPADFRSVTLPRNFTVAISGGNAATMARLSSDKTGIEVYRRGISIHIR